MQLDCIITDRHKQINAYLRDQLHDNPLAANMKHYYDVWHVAKGIFCKFIFLIILQYAFGAHHVIAQQVGRRGFGKEVISFPIFEMLKHYLTIFLS